MRNPPRIAIIGNAALPLTNFRAPLIAAIAGRGHKVFALAPDFSPEAHAAIKALGAEPVDFPLSRTGLNPLADLADARTLRSILASLRLDCVLSFGIKPAIYGTLAASRAGIPARHVLITGLGYSFTDGGDISLKRRVVSMGARILYRRALRQARTVFMQNPDDAADFIRMRIVGPEKLVTVNGTGVELGKWLPAPPVLSPIIFTLAARLLKDKGILEFVEAARIVKSRHPSTRFVLLGSTDSNPQAIDDKTLSAWVENGLVEWPGYVSMPKWLARTSVFVLPSYREGVPRSTQEAMAMARPVITTDAPGCRETVAEGKNGFLVPVRDAQALADAMLKFIEQPSLIDTMGKASRRLAEERFDVRKVNARMIEVMGL